MAFASEPVAKWVANVKFTPLGDDIGRDLVLDESDAVAQVELSLLQPLDLQHIGPGSALERLDRGIEIAMLLHQPREIVAEFPFFLLGHGRI